MKRRMILGLALLGTAAAIREISHSIQYNATIHYWDEVFKDDNADRQYINPRVAELIDRLHAYKLEIERRQRETGEMYGM